MNQRKNKSLWSLALFIALSVNLFAEDWPQWRGPNRDGISQEKDWLVQWPSEGPKQLWKAAVGIGYSSMSVSQGKLYTMGNIGETDHIFCLDANSGKEIWNHSYPCSSKDPNGFPGTRCTPTVDGKFVYTVSRQGNLFCLEAGTGKVVWFKDYQKDYDAKVPRWGFSTSPLVEKNLLIVETGARGAAVIAFDKSSGKEVWKTGDDPAGYSSPVSFSQNGERCVAILNASGIVGFRIKDGKELWRHPWKTMYDVNAATPIIEGDKVFISSGYNTGCALIQFSATPPKVLWQNKNMRNHVNSSVLWKGHLYGFDEKDLQCLDFSTGASKWSEKGFGKGSLMIADGKLIIYSDTGKLAVAEASPSGYREIASAQILGGKNTWIVPVLANGKIYCRSLEQLVCLDVRKK
ncbi:MAG: PQQ-like beta-propeller repeat protein [Verrucomicrobiota bacterium]|nr:PQQ-like beta-propeller repeat protein [Verrucomicrobiota bacterium]